MARFTVRGYLRQIKDVYKTAAGKVAALSEETQKIDRMISETTSSKLLTDEGKRKTIGQLRDRKTAIRKEIDGIRNQAGKDAAEIRSTLDGRFYDRFHMSASELDLQTVELIKTGVLNGAELLHMAEGANYTMKRIIGRALENVSGYQKEARLLQMSVDNPHLRAADEIIHFGDYSCGGAPLSGAAGAKTFLRKFDEVIDPIIDSAPRVAAVTDYQKPGVVTFTADND